MLALGRCLHEHKANRVGLTNAARVKYPCKHGYFPHCLRNMLGCLYILTLYLQASGWFCLIALKRSLDECHENQIPYCPLKMKNPLFLTIYDQII